MSDIKDLVQMLPEVLVKYEKNKDIFNICNLLNVFVVIWDLL